MEWCSVDAIRRAGPVEVGGRVVRSFGSKKAKTARAGEVGARNHSNFLRSLCSWSELLHSPLFKFAGPPPPFTVHSKSRGPPPFPGLIHSPRLDRPGLFSLGSNRGLTASQLAWRLRRRRMSSKSIRYEPLQVHEIVETNSPVRSSKLEINVTLKIVFQWQS